MPPTPSRRAPACAIPAIVDLVAREAPDRIADLVAMGAPFDRNADGSLALGREAAHSRARIVHVKGDAPGAEISAHPGGAGAGNAVDHASWKAFTPSSWRWRMAASSACSPATASAPMRGWSCSGPAR